MSNIRDRGVIDITLVEDNRFILIILDDIEWEFGTRQQHGRMLQDKINDYLNYIASGQAEEARPGLRPVIRILAQHSYSQYCIDFLERVSAFVKGKDDICDIEWTHSPEDEPFEDGFSDDLVFDENKIYPRIKKNLAKDPLKEISMLAPDVSSPDHSNDLIMTRIMDSFIGILVQDTGSTLTYLRYDVLPEGIDVEKLWDKAFENLCRDIRYQTCESKVPGVYGILAGGDFEAESICLTDLWKQIAQSVGDDLIICVPTKDVVFYAPKSDKKLVKKALKLAENMYKSNRKETPHLLFCNDVFVFEREKGILEISKEYSY